MSLSKQKLAIICGGFICLEERKRRRVWVKQWLEKRQRYSHMNLLRDLSIHEPVDLFNFLRMDKSAFEYLLNKVKPLIKKENTVMRYAVSPRERLTITLRYLASGNSYEDLKFLSAVSPQLLGKIIPETCWAIFKTMKQEFLKFPNTQEEWLKISKDFEEQWQFPVCVGAMDGKHIAIKEPPNTGAYFYNYKGFYSIVLFGIANANYEFIYVHVGTNGRISDGGILKETDFHVMLENESLNLPEPQRITEYDMPYVFVGDSAFELNEHIMKPYPYSTRNRDEIIYNYRLSRARRVIENAFGHLSAKFRVLLTTISLTNLKNIDGVVLACCTLHNFLKRSCNSYCTARNLDHEDENFHLVRGDWREHNNQLQDLQVNRTHSNSTGREVRDKLKNYFNSSGAIPHQNNITL